MDKKINLKEMINKLKDEIEKIINELEDEINDSYIYLYDYKNSYLSFEKIQSIINASEDKEDIKYNIGKIIYDEILKFNDSAEYEAGYIAGIKKAINLLKND